MSRRTTQDGAEHVGPRQLHLCDECMVYENGVGGPLLYFLKTSRRHPSFGHAAPLASFVLGFSKTKM